MTDLKMMADSNLIVRATRYCFTNIVAILIMQFIVQENKRILLDCE